VRVGRRVFVAAGVIGRGVAVAERTWTNVAVAGTRVRVADGAAMVGEDVGVLVRRTMATMIGPCPGAGSMAGAASASCGKSTPKPVDADDAITAFVRIATSSKGSSGAGSSIKKTPMAATMSARKERTTRRQPVIGKERVREQECENLF